jgi:hypothetical protein
MLLLIGLAAPAFGQSLPWRAGVARRVITPPELMWMSGYASRDRPAEGTLHDLWAKALVLEDSSGGRGVLISLDLVGISREIAGEICTGLQERHGFTREQIALAASHTHTGPVVRSNLIPMYELDDTQAQRVREYAEYLKAQVVAAVEEALAGVRPAALSLGAGQATFAVNRRNNREADVEELRSRGELKGPVDHEVPVLAVHQDDGTLRAVVFGYACHATVLSSYEWSGDWPGFAQLEIQRRHPGVEALFVAGCGADQNPLPRKTVDHAQAYGAQAADAVDAALAGSRAAVPGPLRCAYREVDLAFDTLPTREQLRGDAASENRYVADRAKLLLAALDRDGALSRTYPYPVQHWGLGPGLDVVFLGGEVVVDYALRLKQERHPHRLWVAGYSNDVMAYIPSRRVLLEGGYEGETAMVYYGLPTRWGPNVEEQVVSAVHELLLTEGADTGSTSN